MTKKSLLIFFSVLVVLGLVSQGGLAEEFLTLESAFDTSLVGLDYTMVEEVEKEDLNNYLVYLPVLSVDHEGTGQISMGGSVNNLIRNRDKEIAFSWKQRVLNQYDQRVQLLKVVAHLYNRIIYYKKEAMLYNNFLKQAIPLYQQLEKEGADEKQLAEFRVEIEFKQHSLDESLKSIQGMMQSIQQAVGMEISFEQIPEVYPRVMQDSFDVDYAPMLQLETIRYDNSITQKELTVQEAKQGVIPDISVRYSLGFGSGSEGLDHRLEIRLSDAFRATTYGEGSYNASYSVQSAAETDQVAKWETVTDYGAQLRLFSYPRFKNQQANEKSLKMDLQRTKNQRESSIDKEEGNILKELGTIEYFYKMYHIYSGKEVVFEYDPTLSKKEQLDLLLEKLDYQLRLEDYRFNYSYLLSFFERWNQESEEVIGLFTTK